MDDYLCYLIEGFTRTNPMDAIPLGALNTTIKLLLDMRQWLHPESDPSEHVLMYPDEEQEDVVEKENDAD
jgi:hypothetical protein